MADEIDTRVSLDLDPDAVFATIEDYDDDTASYLSTAKSAFTEAYSALRAIHDAKAAVAEDPTLTEAGALLKLDDYAHQRMMKVYPLWDTAAASLSSKVDAWTAELSKEVTSKSSQMVSGEVRSFFKSMETGKRMTAISAAIKAGDETTVTAVLGAPPYLSGLEPDMQAVLLREWHEHSNPKLAKMLRAAQAGLAQIEGKLGLLRKQTKEAVGTIKIKGPNFDMHGQYEGEVSPQQLRAKRDKSNKPFAIGL